MFNELDFEYQDQSDIENLDYVGKLKPPFGYYGAKNKIASRITSSLPPHNAWVEAFCGSAAITLAKAPAPIEVINDLDGNIINLFKQLRDNPEELCRLIALSPYSREEFEISRMPSSEEISNIEKARRFLVATMMSVNGSVGSPQNTGFSLSQSYTRNSKEARVSRWYNLPDRLAQIVDRLRSIRIENRDAIELVESFIDRPATLIYLDPPYLMNRSHGYSIDANEEDFHKKLLTLCIDSRSMLLVSGYANKLYDSMLTPEAGWSREIIYTSTRATNGVIQPREEVIWMNSSYTKAGKTRRVPIRLSRKEKYDKKVNPSRSYLISFKIKKKESKS